MDLSSININFWVLQTLAMCLTALLIPGLRVTNPLGALGAVVALAFVNAHVWDAALFFSIPNTFSSQALLLILSNAAIFWLIVKILPGIESSGVVAVIVAPVLFSVLSLGISTYGKNIDWVQLGKRGVEYVAGIRDEFRSSTQANAASEK
ncbi:MAG: phage holin family protein [Deltaproteobacteria bacterium]|nr:phage holin family protein [Deltaproteobacteria bacterium]